MALQYHNGFGLEEEYFDSYLDLLTPEEELTYAKHVEETRQEFTVSILSTPIGMRRVLDILHDIHKKFHNKRQ